ncbi:hypothetical protein [Paraburkholderia lycopersici]|uniref:Uncharacterized protein n=1 Tax=Paraburkholderia lycopersici TaxID=416944 RepID=A0A1G7C2R4_9BURK|nr:hypothetical protein [Paraburkholderia lycopersici]SDE33597.1 hypothetical protein SAMN05421548_14247 [Paraburkholderia lycopersici]
MTPERFHTLVAAYGADARRWPPHERNDALEWARTHRAEADAALDEAFRLDGWLACNRIAPPTHELVEQIVAGAPVSVATAKHHRYWWSGAAFAGVGLAGALAGALTMSLLMPGGAAPAPHDSSYLSTSFGESGADWSESSTNPASDWSDE